jgi:hypothetical protein
MNDGITEVASRCWLVGDCGNCNYYVMELPASRAIELHSRRMGIIRLKVDSAAAGVESSGCQSCHISLCHEKDRVEYL